MSQKREPYEQALRSARAFADREQWRQAFAAYRDARALLPREAESYAGLGEACFALGRLDRALESYTLAARYSRGDMRYLERVADLQERLGLLTEAARTYMAVGELKLRQRRLDEAIYSWQRAVRLEPGLLGAHRRLAMVFQRQGNIIAAVREYLAIARALQMRGESDKALEMCRAALRLDPDNEDVRVAMHLVTHGEKALAEEPESEPAELETPPETDEDTEAMVETVRQIADVFAQEREAWQREQQPALPGDLLSLAARRAQDELTDEIFREEDVEDRTRTGRARLTKLERDALIGQGIDFQHRKQPERAITCYEKAVAGGLRLPAAFFTLGILYHQLGKRALARQALARASRDAAYQPAAEQLLSRTAAS